MLRLTAVLSAFAALIFLGSTAHAEPSYIQMSGSNLIEGYKGKVDGGAKGRYRINLEKGEIRGGYKGLKMRDGHRAIFAWVHDTVAQKSELIGAVRLLSKKNASGSFKIALPEKFKDGNFGDYEILAFSSEKDDMIKKDGKKWLAATTPDKPAGTKKVPSPAFYLFGALPGAKTEAHFCGHGKDFFFANAPDKQTCYDCFCKQKYSACIKAGA